MTAPTPTNNENAIYALSRWRERGGVRVDMLSNDSPSPESSPPWGEEAN